MNTQKIKTIEEYLNSHSSQMEEIIDNLVEFATLHPGHIVPQAYFQMLARIVPQCSIELMILKKIEDEVQIFLIQRPENDPEWPNKWHFPGCIMRFDDTEKTMLDRLLNDELQNSNLKPNLAFTYVTTSKTRRRGPCMHLVHIEKVVPNTEFETGQFYNINKLPEKTIHHHRDMIGEMKTRWLKTNFFD
ncbi:hypothetical protein COY25_04475 [Candidatus Uhrbacteria bacterium CG_4_10_14_0_2_um_filter_41_7]|uniref:Nudix hydrolase domain-containing protein n=1 Tax=Candidatus Uhrbacteria bacterium CG_4_9_14_3_um_filter_41_35 TaxID=1975034 RepID=A0A2M7XFK4_9BACT|nr:MAG: hypothetical protein COV92_01755 [Candidatus Uhrbacteria bacterium CG11_big_fil_rev_8_21_14_0_20_41_9]PIZ52881.1 MAG: hypothetical protein COY25_04475 [Candidatus Uhrbacteria bacterium CG_4_10_14_0_2_um_filter_41_7]PJA46641.1 MAG: hypothetical protein CO173_02635 [Candidatus Uhrbacteria bacterium CG_4_9_14_3_um_filter_41_35]